MILAVSFPADDHLRAVGRELDALGARWSHVDLADFPRRASMAFRYGPRVAPDFRLHPPGGPEIRLGEVETIWWRRPRPPAPVGPVREEHRRFAFLECSEALDGLWRALPCRWVDPPAECQAAQHKTWQLALAREAGLAIPRTLVTNDPAAARAFLSSRRPAVYKALHAERTLWRETRLVGPSERRVLGAVRVAPVIFQEHVRALRDVRVTVVGHEVFATAIDARETAYPWDYRYSWAEAAVAPCGLPQPVERAVRRLVARMGLSYSAIDLRVRPDGEHVFLELNPGGQWLGFAERTGQPIAAALARLLVGRQRRRRARA